MSYIYDLAIYMRFCRGLRPNSPSLHSIMPSTAWLFGTGGCQAVV